MNLFDRFVLALYSLVLTAVSIIAIAVSVRLIPADWVGYWIYMVYNSDSTRISLFVLSAIFLLISLRFFTYGFRKRGKISPTIDRQGEIGDIRISLDTVESIASRAAKRLRGIRELQAKAIPVESGTAIRLKVTVDGEASIPQLTDELQKNVKHDVEQIAGIHVDKVTVLVTDIVRSQVARSRVE